MSCTLHLTASWFNSTKQADIFTKKERKKKPHLRHQGHRSKSKQWSVQEDARGKHGRVQRETGTDCSLVLVTSK